MIKDEYILAASYVDRAATYYSGRYGGDQVNWEVLIFRKILIEPIAIVCHSLRGGGKLMSRETTTYTLHYSSVKPCIPIRLLQDSKFLGPACPSVPCIYQ